MEDAGAALGNAMRICLYTNTALPCVGGQELVVDELARRYQGAGHEVTVLCPVPPHGLAPRDHELPYPVVRHRRFLSTRWFVDWHLTALTRLHRRFPYDLIHCHNVYPGGYLAALHRQRGGPPVVITSHGGDVRVDNPRFRKRGLRERHALAVRSADRLVSISRFTEEGFLHLDATPEQLTSIPNGVNAELFQQTVSRPAAIPGRLESSKYLLFLGRLVPLKGVDILLRAVQQWRAESETLPHVVIAGDGSERPGLEALRAELGLETQVTFVGYVRGVEKVWLLQNAFALVIPSREREGFPLVLLEAFAAGGAVVASDAKGLKDLVEPGRTGWVVPRNDPAALAHTLRELWDEPERTEQVRRHVRNVAAACDWRRVTERHLALYEEVLAESRRARRAA